MSLILTLTADNGAISQVTIPDPVVATIPTTTRGIITAFNPTSDNWQELNNMIIDDAQWFVENANKSWSLTKLDNKTIRMEVRKGDLWGDDGTSRSEILTVAGFAVGTIFNATWNMMIEAGSAGTMAWRSTAQIHDGSPFVSLSILNDKMNILINQSGNGSTPFQDTQPIQRGHVYSMKLQMKKSQGSDGFLKIWRDGIQIVDYVGQLGSSSDDATFKLGIYQGWPENVSSTTAIQYSNIAVDIPKPLPPPPLPSGLNKIGVTTLGTTDGGNAGYMFAQPVVLPTVGTLQSLSFYCNNASGNLKMAVYSDSNGKPANKIAETASAATISGWNTKSVITPVVLQPGKYWLVYEISSNSLVFRNGGGGQFVGVPQTYGTMPAIFPTPTISGNDSWSFYMTVNI